MAEPPPPKPSARRAAYARRNARWLAAVFATAIAVGVWRDNAAALIAGAGGLVWVILSLSKGETR